MLAISWIDATPYLLFLLNVAILLWYSEEDQELRGATLSMLIYCSIMATLLLIHSLLGLSQITPHKEEIAIQKIIEENDGFYFINNKLL